MGDCSVPARTVAHRAATPPWSEFCGRLRHGFNILWHKAVITNILHKVQLSLKNMSQDPDIMGGIGAGAWSPVLRMYVTAMPVIAMLAMAENYIRTNSMELQCVV